MRILYIYRDYFIRRKFYGREMEKCGYKVAYLEAKSKKKKNTLSVKDIKRSNPGLVWFLNPFYVKNNPIALEYIKSKKIPIVVYSTYNPQEPYDSEEWMKTWGQIDFFFVQNKEFHKFLKKKGFNSYYMPLAFHSTQYYRMVNKRRHDVSFCGAISLRANPEIDPRVIFAKSLSEFNIVVYGESFKDKLGVIPVYSYKTHREQRLIYSQTKINLDLPFFSICHSFYDNKFHFKNRFFEIPATGNFLLTCRCPEFLDIFDEGIVGYYDDNIESLKENVNKYLKDKKLRRQMTERAYKLVHAKHTFKHRFKEMFKIIEK